MLYTSIINSLTLKLLLRAYGQIFKSLSDCRNVVKLQLPTRAKSTNASQSADKSLNRFMNSGII